MTTRRILRFSLLGLFNLTVCLGFAFSIGIATAQFETEPHPMDTFIKGITNFSEPTGIRGTLRYIEEDRETIWLNWEQRSDEGPLFTTGWKLVPGEATLAVQPQSPAQWEELRQLSKGISLELIIQDDGKGHRLIHSYRDLSEPPKVPL